MKVVIAGGHFSPALAVIEELMLGKHDVLVVGRKYSFEADSGLSYEYIVCKQRNIPFVELDAGRLQRKFSRQTIPSLLKIPGSLFGALAILQNYRPDVVLVFGGYLALPVALSAKLLNIPVFVHEQTTGASLANRQIAKFAKDIFISFETSKPFFPKEKTVLTGNPLRAEIFEVKKSIEVPQTKHLMYVTGGSTGSHFINMLIYNNIWMLFEKFPDLVIIHQSGDSREYDDYNLLLRKRDVLDERLRKRYIVKKFIMPEEVGWVYKHADLIISRAGINSVCEYIALAKMAILIPLTHGQKSEQLTNAKFYESEARLGYMLEEGDCSPEAIYKMVDFLFSGKTRKRFLRHAVAAASLVKLSASKTIVDKLQFFHEKEKRGKA